MEPIVIVGGGLAGATACTELREIGYDGPIVVFGAEHHLPYERPPLSKAYLMGKEPFENAFVHPPKWYDENDIDLRMGTEVTGLNLAERQVETADGTQGYDKLLLATGSRPRHLPMADDAGVPVAYLRNIEDSDRIRESLVAGTKLVIIGAGWIGLEVASAARDAGVDVTIFEMAELPLLRVLGPEVAQVFADLHRSHGVDLRLGVSVTADDLAGADLVLVGIGAAPNVELAEQAGLAVDHGVLVDAGLRTSDPHVWAAGDIANQDHPALGRLRVEHWDTAIEQGKVAAHNLVGRGEEYARLPYFFTDQYDWGMEYVGHGGQDDDVRIIGDPAAGLFRAFWLRDGVVSAGMHVNDWDAIEAIREQVGKPYRS